MVGIFLRCVNGTKDLVSKHFLFFFTVLLRIVGLSGFFFFLFAHGEIHCILLPYYIICNKACPLTNIGNLTLHLCG